MNQRRDVRGRFAPSRMVTPAGKIRPPTTASVGSKNSVKTSKPKKVTVMARYGELEIPTNKITEETRWAYRAGQCFALAITVAEKKNTKVGLLVAGCEFPWGSRYDDVNLMLNINHDWFGDSIHAVALASEGTEDEDLILDIDGARDQQSVRQEFEDIHSGTLIQISPGALRVLLRKYSIDTGFYEQNYEAALIISELIDEDY